ncbi:unnamed protein product [Pseudo-nitzschia multistriata]|uniref:Acid phosphatase n=1 Tax=Pseudo-nitzschia multistriata TaxID=183589 RepID=A0A448YYV8_9STRA|nr:unnamed protein product [Pseudo-nitzschia multistriata]
MNRRPPDSERPSLRMTTKNAIMIGSCMLLAFLQLKFAPPSPFLSDPEQTLPLPLTSSMMFEQYENGGLYKTHFEAPYTEYPCQPRKIHLSPSSDVDPGSNVFNATVSFNLDAKGVVQHSDVVTTVEYGLGNNTEGKIVIRYDNLNNNTITDDFTILRFNYTNPETGEFYQSDLIHHVLLKDLKAGRERYWYHIKVELVEQRLFSESAMIQPSVHSILLSQTNPNNNAPLRGSPLRDLERYGHATRSTNRMEEQPQSKTSGGDAAATVVVGETPVYEFTTPPLYGQPTSIALVGDLGQTKNSTRTMARILDAAKGVDHDDLSSDEPQGVGLVTNLFIAGDLSYSDGDPHRWDSWLDLAEPLLREVPFASIPGNHEIECNKVTRETFVPYESYFRNPNRIEKPIMIPPSEDYINHNYCTTPSEFLEGHYDYGNAYYSYKQGLVHAIFLNSYTSLMEGSRQRKWLVETALPSVDRSLTPWLVVVFHTPLYTTFLNHFNELNPTVMKESGLREVFQNHKVNLVLSGHDHAYLRTKPLMPDGSVAADGKVAPVFWTLGAGGNREGHATYINPFWQEKWVAKRNNDEFGFGLFFAPNRTHAHLRWMRDDDNGPTDGAASTKSMVVRDSVWIENYSLE